jgi:hypothetical protein
MMHPLNDGAARRIVRDYALTLEQLLIGDIG